MKEDFSDNNMKDSGSGEGSFFSQLFKAIKSYQKFLNKSTKL